MANPVSIPSPQTESAALLTHRLWLRDNKVVIVRPIQPNDSERIQRFHARLSPASILMRYFHMMPVLSDALAAAFTHVDYADRMALVATIGGDKTDNASSQENQEIVSLVNYERQSIDTAEIAFVVEDAWQGYGIGSALLYDLAAYARERSFHYFLAIMLYRNIPMLNLLRRSGFPCVLRDRGDDEVAALLDITAAPMCRLAPAASSSMIT